jgi:hypothetical protein
MAAGILLSIIFAIVVIWLIKCKKRPPVYAYVSSNIDEIAQIAGRKRIVITRTTYKIYHDCANPFCQKQRKVVDKYDLMFRVLNDESESYLSVYDGITVSDLRVGEDAFDMIRNIAGIYCSQLDNVPDANRNKMKIITVKKI